MIPIYWIRSLYFFQFQIYRKPIKAPPRWAKCAILSPLNCPNPKNIEAAMIIGVRYLALIGKGINIIIISALGYNAVKAATTPNIAPDAPTILEINDC